MKTKRAWYAQYAFEAEASVIVFAETRGKARYRAARELEVDQFTDRELRLERKPQFDQYVERGRVPDAALLKDGWWIDGCSKCGRGGQLSASDIEDGEAYILGDDVLCLECARAAGVAVDEEAAHA